jgi:hypothetical protein
MSNLLSNLTVQQLKRAIAIREQIETLEGQLSEILNQPAGATDTAAPEPRRRAGKRTMSDEVRARIAETQRARWARVRGARGTAPAKPTKAKRVLSAEGRAAIIAATKARWARFRAAKKKA